MATQKKSPTLSLSVSRVNLFEQCQAKYYYKYILGLPDAPTYHSLAGSFLHKVLELFVVEYLKTNLIKESLQHAYIAAKQDPEIQPHITSEMTKEVKGWVQNFAKKLQKDPSIANNFVAAETRFRFQIEGTKIFINGFIDRIDTVEDDSIRIIDYKTTGRSDLLKPFQLIVYSIPTQIKYPNKKILASYELVKKDFQRQDYTITDEDRKAAIDKIVSVGEQILNLTSLKERTAWKKNPSYLCHWCPYRVQCYSDNNSSWNIFSVDPS